MTKDSDDKFHDIVYSDEVVEFSKAALEFCSMIENINQITREEFIENTYKILVILQVKAVLLPETEANNEFETESFVNEQDWYFVDTGVSGKLGIFETFSELREPLKTEEPFEISISECIADTYQELKDFIMLYQVGNLDAIYQGLNECKTGYKIFWGPRIMIVIKEFHNLIFGDTDIADDI